MNTAGADMSANNIAENISANLGGWTVWGWRTDAAHHRMMLRGDLRACGVGVEGRYVTCVAGDKDDSPLAGLLKLRGNGN